MTFREILHHSPGLELYLSWPLPLLSPLLLSLAAILLSLSLSSPAPLVSVTTSRMTMFSLFHSLFLQLRLVFLWKLYNSSLCFIQVDSSVTCLEISYLIILKCSTSGTSSHPPISFYYFFHGIFLYYVCIYLCVCIKHLFLAR